MILSQTCVSGLVCRTFDQIEELVGQLQGHEIADPDWRNASQDIKDGLGNMLPAARTRANATYYGFIVLSIGLIVMVCFSLCFAQYSSHRTRPASGLSMPLFG